MLHNYHSSNVKKEALRVVYVKLLCTQEVLGLKQAMSKAFQMLVKKEEDLPAPINPPFIDEKKMELHET
uniref:Protein kinase family protein n=1 Tax=Solanum tuberosum TaxID=4113 RepID=M1BF64_SOLTU